MDAAAVDHVIHGREARGEDAFRGGEFWAARTVLYVIIEGGAVEWTDQVHTYGVYLTFCRAISHSVR